MVGAADGARRLPARGGCAATCKGRLRLAARRAARAAVRAGRGAARRARLRGVGAVPRARASRAGSTCAWTARSRAASTSAATRSTTCSRRRSNKAGQIALSLSEAAPRQPLDAARSRRRAGRASSRRRCSRRPGSVLAVAGVGGSTAPPEPPSAQALRRARLQQPCGASSTRATAARPGVVTPGEHRRPAGAAQRAPGHRAGPAGRWPRTSRRCRRARAITRRSRSRGRR